jgi:hypothetical protein
VNLATLWNTYCELYYTLFVWCQQYVDEDVAHKCVRLALARLFQLACIAWETQWGPFYEAAELCLGMMVREGMRPDAVIVGGPIATCSLPSDQFMYRLSHLYATVYSLSVSASWTTTEREQLAMVIRTDEPDFISETVYKVDLGDGRPELDPLRRALIVLEEHVCGQALVCVVSEQLWHDEHARGREYIRWSTPIEG